MNRKMMYPGQIPLSAQILQTEQNTMVALAKMCETIFGTPTLADGLACTGTVVPSLTIQIAAGQIFQIQSLESTSFGSLFADTTHNIVKQGVNLDQTSFTLVPPGIAGQAVNVLVQAQIQEVDTDNLVLSYVNTSSPSTPFSGPNNSGALQPTTRKTFVNISVKYGISAISGVQVTPSPDAGFTGLYYVTVGQGATTIGSGNIFQLPTAPFLYKRLPELPAWIQGSTYGWSTDSGGSNAIMCSFTPSLAIIGAGFRALVRKSAMTNTGNVTIDFGFGSVALLDVNGAQVGAGNLPAGCIMHVGYDGSVGRLLNGAITQTTISSITATSGEGITVGGANPYPVALNYPALTPAIPMGNSLISFYETVAAHHRTITWSALLAMILGASPVARNLVQFTSAGVSTCTVPPNVYWLYVLVVGGGCSGGCGTPSMAGGGGGAGGSSEGWFPVIPGQNYMVTIGSGGAIQTTVGSGGLAGGTSSFGLLLSAPGAPSAFTILATGSNGGAAGTGGQLNLPGSTGSDGTSVSSALGGIGGCSRLGGGGRMGTGAGVAGQVPGAGGGGCYGGTGGPSGKGADGGILIQY